MGRRLAAAFVAVVAVGCSGGSTSSSSRSSGSPTSLASVETTTTAVLGQPGAAGLGDPYFAGLGNGGYDVSHYDIALSVDLATSTIAGTTTITATATQALSSFDIDLSGLDVSAVALDGRSAPFTRAGDELVVTPSAAIASGATMTVAVTYGGTPAARTVPGAPGLTSGWSWQGTSSYVLAEPDAASTWFPGNDHPADKATFTFSITAPADVQVAANGVLTTHDGNRWVYAVTDPMATYLATVVVGPLTFTSDPGPGGVTIRNAFPTSIVDAATAAFAPQPDMLEYFSTVFGPYPFHAYGAVLAPGVGGAAFESQTLSLFDADLLPRASVVAHELAHQWFGDSVSLRSWRDIWLNEGFATYAEWLWSEHTGGPPAATIAAEVAKRQWSAPGDPGVDAMFDRSVYERGALTLEALRQTVGDDAFFATLSTYATQFRNGNAATADFVAIAERVAGRSLTSLFDAWLTSPQQPTLPA